MDYGIFLTFQMPYQISKKKTKIIHMLENEKVPRRYVSDIFLTQNIETADVCFLSINNKSFPHHSQNSRCLPLCKSLKINVSL